MFVGQLSDPAVGAALQKAQAAPGRWQVCLIESDGRRRTPAQNRLFRRVLQRFAQQQGGSVQYWHDFLVEKYLGFQEVDSEDGYTRRVLCSTGDLDVAEFTSFLTACLRFADENHVDVR